MKAEEERKKIRSLSSGLLYDASYSQTLISLLSLQPGVLHRGPGPLVLAWPPGF